MRLLFLVLLTLFLSACGQATTSAGEESYASADAAAAPEAAMADAVATDASADAVRTEPGKPPVPAGVPLLAYSYQYGIHAPPKSVRALAAGHEAACVAAGLAVCQVTSSEVQEFGEDQVRATLTLRATPAWLKRFRAGLAGETRSAGGRVTAANVSSEDLSRQIVDTEANLRAKTTLRDRLQALLASRPGKLADLIELERELARVQGEIDATQSELSVMRTRVATSDLTVNYASAGVLAPEGVLSPLGEALSDVLAIFVGTLAFMVRLVAVLAPLVLIVGGLLWVFRKRLPKIRLRRRKPEDAAPPA